MNKPTCPACGRLNIMYRQGDNAYWCRICGHVWPAPAKEPSPAEK